MRLIHPNDSSIPPSIIIVPIVLIIFLVLLLSIFFPRSRSLSFPIIPMLFSIVPALFIFIEYLLNIIFINRPQFHLLEFFVIVLFYFFHHIFNIDFWIIKNNNFTLEFPILVVLNHPQFFNLSILLKQFLNVIVGVVSIYVLYIDTFILLISDFTLYLISVHSSANRIHFL